MKEGNSSVVTEPIFICLQVYEDEVEEGNGETKITKVLLDQVSGYRYKAVLGKDFSRNLWLNSNRRMSAGDVEALAELEPSTQKEVFRKQVRIVTAKKIDFNAPAGCDTLIVSYEKQVDPQRGVVRFIDQHTGVIMPWRYQTSQTLYNALDMRGNSRWTRPEFLDYLIGAESGEIVDVHVYKKKHEEREIIRKRIVPVLPE